MRPMWLPGALLAEDSEHELEQEGAGDGVVAAAQDGLTAGACFQSCASVPTTAFGLNCAGRAQFLVVALAGTVHFADDTGQR